MTDMRYLVDGMLSGTGIRDVLNGGYVKPQDMRLSGGLIEEISIWLSKYEDAHYDRYRDTKEVEALDELGIDIAKKIVVETGNEKVGYFSSVHMRELPI